MRATLIFLAVLWLGSCDSVAPDVVATYQGGEVTDDELYAFISSLPPGDRRVDASDPQAWWQRQVREAVVSELLLVEMQALGVSSQDRFVKLTRAYVRDVLVSGWVQDNVRFEPPSNEELRLRFEADRGNWVVPEGRLVASIFLAYSPQRDVSTTRRLADKLVRELRGGASFEELARQWSDSDTRLLGGVLGWVKRDSYSAQLNEILWSLPLRSVSDPQLTADGVHLFSVLQRRQRVEPTFEQVRPALLADEMQIRSDQAIAPLLEPMLDSLQVQLPSPAETQALFQSAPSAREIMRVGAFSLTVGEFRSVVSREGIAANKIWEWLQDLGRRELVFQCEFPKASEDDLDAVTRRKLQGRLLSSYRQQRTRQWMEAQDVDLQSYFDAHRSRYETPERIAMTRLSWTLSPDARQQRDALQAMLATNPTREEIEASGAHWVDIPAHSVADLGRLDPHVPAALDEVDDGHWTSIWVANEQLNAVRVVERWPSQAAVFYSIRRRLAADLLASQPARYHAAFIDAVMSDYSAVIHRIPDGV